MPNQPQPLTAKLSQRSSHSEALTADGSHLFSPSRCYRPDEIAHTLGLSTRTVYRLINDIEDPLPAYRPTGTVLRVHGHDLIAWLDRRKVNPLEE